MFITGRKCCNENPYHCMVKIGCRWGSFHNRWPQFVSPTCLFTGRCWGVVFLTLFPWLLFSFPPVGNNRKENKCAILLCTFWILHAISTDKATSCCRVTNSGGCSVQKHINWERTFLAKKCVEIFLHFVIAKHWHSIVNNALLHLASW